MQNIFTVPANETTVIELGEVYDLQNDTIKVDSFTVYDKDFAGINAVQLLTEFYESNLSFLKLKVSPPIELQGKNTYAKLILSDDDPDDP